MMVKGVLYAVAITLPVCIPGTPGANIRGGFNARSDPAQTTDDSAAATSAPTGVTEYEINYVRKAHTKSGKNYIGIAYIQSLTEQDAADAF